jgi:alpha-glucoside transport system substrate-binding protein
MKAFSMRLVGVVIVVSFLAACGPAPVQPSATPPPATAAPSALEEAFAGKYKGTTVHVGSVWIDPWAADFEASLKDFEEKSGITIQYEVVDQAGAELRAEIEAGTGPDVVEFTYPVPLMAFAREGKVVDLRQFLDMETLRSRIDQNWLDWATMDGPDGPILAGLWDGFYLDSVVFYPKAAFDQAGYQVPATWEELLALSNRIIQDGGTPWCIENGDGFGAVHWIGDTMLRTVAPADYYAWIKGRLPFNSAPVKKAVQLMDDVWFEPGYAYGTREALNTAQRWDVGYFLLDTPPKCWLMKEPNWIWTFDGKSTNTALTNNEYGQDYDFFLLPAIDQAHGAPVQAEAHITGMFQDRPEVRALMEYLSTGAQIEAWIKLGHSAGLSPYKGASLDWYTIPQERAAAEIAQAAQQAGNLQFVAGDSMEAEVSAAFYESMKAYVAGEIDLDTALKQIDAARPAPAATP